MLLVDSRVGSIDLATPLSKHRLVVEVTHLQFGDVAFCGSGQLGPVDVGIELKTIGDLANSFRTGRLQGHQVPGLMRAYDHVWLIVEGTWKVGAHGELLVYRRNGKLEPLPGKFTVGEFEKRLLTVEMMSGGKLHVRHTFTRRETVEAIASLYRWWCDRTLNEHKSNLVAHMPPLHAGLSDFRKAVVVWPGIGIERSKAVEDHFGGKLIAAANATEAEWLKIDGIGKETVKRVMRFLGRV